MKYFKQFIVGTSALITVPFFYYFALNYQPKKNYSYSNYTLISPFWFAIWNVISLLLAEYFDLTMKQRFLLISVISSISIMLITTYLKSYNFTQNEWNKYYLYIFIKYLLIWNILIYFIEKNL